MKLQVLPYVTVEIDDRLRRRLRRAGDRLRVDVRAYLLSAADEVDVAGDKARNLCDRAINRVDSVVERVNDRLGTDEAKPQQPRLHVGDGRERRDAVRRRGRDAYPERGGAGSRRWTATLSDPVQRGAGPADLRDSERHHLTHPDDRQ